MKRGADRGTFIRTILGQSASTVNWELVDRARSSGNVRNSGTRTGNNSDWGTTWGNKLDYSRLVPAEGTHAGRLHRSRSGIHFESVEYAVHGDSSGGVEQIAALNEWGVTQ